MSVNSLSNILMMIVLMVTAGMFCCYGQQSFRNLSNYRAGPETDTFPYSGPATEEDIALRKFVYGAWVNKTRAFVKVNHYSREGLKTPCIYFIEPLPDGKWIVLSECMGICMWKSKKDCDERPSTILVYDVVERSGPNSGDRLLFKSSITGRKEEL